MTKLNPQLIETAQQVLTKKDRLAIFERCSFDKVSSVYAALQGKRKVSNTDYDVIQDVIRKAANK